MTLVAETPYEYIAGGDGTVTDFEFDFTVSAAGDVEVYIEDDDETSEDYGERTLQVLDTDYTVALNLDGTGTVTFASAVGATEAVFIRRVTPKTQETDYVDGDKFPADSHEEALDKNMRIQQEQQATLDACLRFPEFESGCYETEIPKKELRAEKMFGFDADGKISMVDLITQDVLDNIEDAETNSAASAAAASASATAAGEAQAAAESAQSDAEAAQTAAEEARDAIPAAGTILVDSDIDAEGGVQGYDADILKADTNDVLQACFGQEGAEGSTTPAFTGSNIQTLTITEAWNLPLLTGEGALLFNVVGNYTITPHTSYKKLSGYEEYDYSIGGGCTILLINDGTRQVIGLNNWQAAS